MSLELVDLGNLEKMWDEEHCADAHRFPENRICTHVPTHHLTATCGHLTDSPRCERSAAVHQIWMAEGRVTCAGCGKPGRECWRLT